MKRRILTLTIFVLSLGLMFTGAAFAEEQERTRSEDEDTMAVVEQNEGYKDFEKQITLPDPAAEEGVGNSADGLERANEAREGKQHEFGMERAQEARQNEMREEVRERNQENIQDRMPEQDAIRDRAREHMPTAK